MFAGCDGRLRVDPVPPGTYEGTRGDQRRGARTVAHVQVAAAADPRWVSLPIVMHREVPAGAVVRTAKLHAWREASHVYYQLQLTVLLPDAPMVPVRAETAVGVDLGWRWQESVRVAYVARGDGTGGPVTLPNDVPAAFDKSASLRSIRDRNFDDARRDLAEWMASHDAPDWLREMTSHLAQWRAAAKLASVAIAWRDRRFAGDRGVFKAVEAWRKQDKHLWEWEHNGRRKALARREQGYRTWAAEIARSASLVVLEDFDLRQVARKPPVEEQGDHDDLARSQRIAAAPGVLRSALVDACRSRGVRVVLVAPAFTTLRGEPCGAVPHGDAARYLSHRCPACGAIWDQDANAAANILRQGTALVRAEALGGGEESVEDAAPRVGRWQKRREAKAAKRVQRRRVA